MWPNTFYSLFYVLPCPQSFPLSSLLYFTTAFCYQFLVHLYVFYILCLFYIVLYNRYQCLFSNRVCTTVSLIICAQSPTAEGSYAVLYTQRTSCVCTPVVLDFNILTFPQKFKWEGSTVRYTHTKMSHNILLMQNST